MNYLDFIEEFINVCGNGTLSQVKEEIKKLRKEKINLNSVQGGYTGFSRACRSYNKIVIDYLITLNDIDVNVTLGGKSCICSYMIEYDHHDITKMITEERKDLFPSTLVDIYCLKLKNTPVFYVGESIIDRLDNMHEKKCPYLREIENILDRIQNLNLLSRVHGTSTLLFGACENGYIDLVEILLKRGASINSSVFSNRPSPLQVTCLLGYSRILSLFLEHKEIEFKCENSFSSFIDPHYTTDDAFIQACFYNRMKCIKLLLNHERRTELDIQTGFCVACTREYKDLIDVIYETKLVTPNGLDSNNKETPLHSWCKGWRGDEKIFIFLLREGADPNIRDNNGDNVLDVLLKNGYSESSFLKKTIEEKEKFIRLIRTLLDRGAMTNLDTSTVPRCVVEMIKA